MAKRVGDSPTSVRFTEEDVKIMKRLEAKLGISRAAILKLAIRRLAVAEKV